MGKQLLEKMKLNVSKVSGETVDINQIEGILNKVLKPFEKTKIPDIPIEGIVKNPTSLELENAIVGKIPGGRTETPISLNLSEVHELRKNIGKLVSDRAFYAQPDQAMKVETEVLRDLYRELGDVIKKQLSGRKVAVGSKHVDAADFYSAQNNRLKSFLDIESMLEYVPTELLKEPDVAAKLSGMMAQAGVWGAGGIAASLGGLPINPVVSGIAGATFGASKAASSAVESAAPEYLTSIFKQAAKIAPAGAAATQRGTIQFMRNGEFVPESKMGREPQSIDMSPKQLINYRIPRNTQGILENKDKVIAKLVQSGLDDNTIDTIAQALNGDEDDVANLMPQLSQQFGYLFEKSKYKTFDGRFVDPNDKAKAADDISKRDDLNSIQRAKMISKINKTGEMPEGM